MKQGSTLFLRVVVFLIGIPVLGFCIGALPWLANHPVNAEYAGVLYPILIGIYTSAIPFYFALYQAFLLLSYIDKGEAFSQLSVKALKRIKYCAVAVSVIYGSMLPFIYFLADKDDSPGLIVIGMTATFASIVIAIFAAVLQRLLQEAIDIKAENDLTV